jgi:hypothetical protein
VVLKQPLVAAPYYATAPGTAAGGAPCRPMQTPLGSLLRCSTARRAVAGYAGRAKGQGLAR